MGTSCYEQKMPNELEEIAAEKAQLDETRRQIAAEFAALNKLKDELAAQKRDERDKRPRETDQGPAIHVSLHLTSRHCRKTIRQNSFKALHSASDLSLKLSIEQLHRNLLCMTCLQKIALNKTDSFQI